MYVLRLWREQAASAEHLAEWRFVLEEPKTGQRRGFAGLDALMAFLEIELQGQEIIETKNQRGDIK